MSFEMHCMSTYFFGGSIDTRTWRGYRLYGLRVGPTDNFSLVTGSTAWCQHHSAKSELTFTQHWIADIMYSIHIHVLIILCMY